MIAGVGVDTVEIRRIEQFLRRHAAAGRVYGPAESAFLKEEKGPAGYLASCAANFCAKEAFAKAMGTGVRGFSLHEVELLRDPAGKPFFHLSGDAARLAEGVLLHVSVTHTRTHATAFVVAETGGSL